MVWKHEAFVWPVVNDIIFSRTIIGQRYDFFPRYSYYYTKNKSYGLEHLVMSYKVMCFIFYYHYYII